MRDAVAAIQAALNELVEARNALPEEFGIEIDKVITQTRILLDSLPQSTALRASIVIGARSSSFGILVKLVSSMRFVPLPSWRSNRTQPIFEGDTIEYLARTPWTPEAEGRSLDIVGPEVMTYEQMIERIAEAIGVGRMPLRLPTTQTPAASAVVSAITSQPIELVRPLMESLEHDLLPRNDDAHRIYGLTPHPLADIATAGIRLASVPDGPAWRAHVHHRLRCQTGTTLLAS